MKKAFSLIVLAVSVSCSCEKKTEALDAGQALPGLGQLVTITGKVELVRNGQQQAARAGALYGGDELITEAESGATLTLGTNRTLELGPLSHLILGSDGVALTLDLQAGLAVTRVSGGSGVMLSIETPLGITRIADGEVRLTVGGQDAKVEVLIGEAEQILRSGEKVQLPAGSARSSAVKVLEPVELSLVINGATIELKAAGENKFTRVKAKDAVAVSAGDTVRVREGRAILRPGNAQTSIFVNRGGEVTVGAAKQNEAADEAHLSLAAGPLQIDAAQGRKTRVDLGALGFESTTGGQLLVTKTKSGYVANAYTGTWRLERPDDEQRYELQGGSSARIDQEIALKDNEREALALPSRQGLTLYQTGLDAAALTWDCDAQQEFEVEVANSGSFENPFRRGLVNQCFINVPLPRRGTIHWRVSAEGKKVAQGSVTIGPEPQAGKELSRLNNDVVDGPEVTSIYFQDKPPLVTFRCQQNPSAVSYRLRVFFKEQLSRPAAERASATPSMSVAEGVLVEGHYLWACDALDKGGAELAGGRLNKLDMVYDNAVASLLIKSPRAGERVGDTVKVAGIAPIGSRLYVDGKPMALDATARFDDEVRVPSSGLLIFRLFHQGSERFLVRSVRGR